MRLIPVAAFVALALGLTTPAQALTRKQLDCPAKAVKPEVASRISELVLADNENDPELDQQWDKLDGVAAACMKQTKVPAAQQDAYFEYAKLSATRSGFLQRITAAGLKPALIDATMDVGPGRSNPVITDLKNEQVEKLIKALTDSGVDILKMDEAIWPVVGGYLPLTSRVSSWKSNLALRWLPSGGSNPRIYPQIRRVLRAPALPPGRLAVRKIVRILSA